jgi:hypothetical protein
VLQPKPDYYDRIRWERRMINCTLSVLLHPDSYDMEYLDRQALVGVLRAHVIQLVRTTRLYQAQKGLDVYPHRHQVPISMYDLSLPEEGPNCEEVEGILWATCEHNARLALQGLTFENLGLPGEAVGEPFDQGNPWEDRR